MCKAMQYTYTEPCAMIHVVLFDRSIILFSVHDLLMENLVLQVDFYIVVSCGVYERISADVEERDEQCPVPTVVQYVQTAVGHVQNQIVQMIGQPRNGEERRHNNHGLDRVHLAM